MPGVAGLNLKLATPWEDVMVRVLLVLFEPRSFETVKVTFRNPAEEYECIGFCSVLVVPSPKSQDHDLGFPSIEPVNSIAWPAEGYLGL